MKQFSIYLFGYQIFSITWGENLKPQQKKKELKPILNKDNEIKKLMESLNE